MSRAKSRTCHGKVRYRDVQEARDALRHLNERKPYVPVVRAYACGRCKGAHLTSRAAR